MDHCMLAAAAASERGIITDMLAILASAAVVAIVMQRMRLGVIPAYLVTGALIGPRALSLVPSPESLGAVSHLAIILLLFSIGLELNLSALRHGLWRMVLAGLGSCVLSILLGWPVAIRMGLSAPVGLTVCMGLALSSTALVLRIMAVRRELRRASGRLALSILVIQDMLVLVMLACLPGLANWAAAGSDPQGPAGNALSLQGGWLPFALDVAVRIGGAAALIVIGKLLLPRLLRESFTGRSLEVMMVVGVAAALASAVAAQTIGFSIEMGAFLAGFVLAGTQLRHQLSAQIGPLRDISMAVFFTALGMKLDPAIVVQWWWVIVVGVVVMTVLKAAAIAGTGWALGATASVAITVGLSLAQAGEFSLIFLGAAHNQGILGEGITAITIGIVVVSLILTPALVEAGNRLARAARRIGPAPWIGSPMHRAADPDGGAPGGRAKNVIIAGFGPSGRQMYERLENAGVSCTIVELNPATVRAESRVGKSIILGDVGNPEILEAAGIAVADALVLTIPDEEAVLRACAAARRRAPDIFIAARTGVVSQMEAVMEAGANHVTADEMATADSMLGPVLDSVRLREEGGWSDLPVGR